MFFCSPDWAVSAEPSSMWLAEVAQALRLTWLHHEDGLFQLNYTPSVSKEIALLVCEASTIQLDIMQRKFLNFGKFISLAMLNLLAMIVVPELDNDYHLGTRHAAFQSALSVLPPDIPQPIGPIRTVELLIKKAMAMGSNCSSDRTSTNSNRSDTGRPKVSHMRLDPPQVSQARTERPIAAEVPAYLPAYPVMYVNVAEAAFTPS